MPERREHPPGSIADPGQIPDSVEELLTLALDFHQKGQLAHAQEIYAKILEISPNHYDALHLLGVVAYQTQNHQRAVELIDQAIALYPYNAAFYSNRGAALKELSLFDLAVESYDKATELNPDYADAWYNRGNVLQNLKQFGLAVASYNKAISLKPDHAGAYSNRGVALQELKLFDLAVESCDKAIELNPAYADAWYNRGNSLQALKRLDEAIANYDRAIVFKPAYAEAWSNRGNALMVLEQFDLAIVSYEQAIAFKPEYAEAWSNRGNALQALKQFDLAVVSYEKAIALRSEYADAWYNRGIALLELKQPEAAIASYDEAIAVKPEYADAWYNRGNAQKELKEWREAADSMARALSINPDIDYLSGAYFHLLMMICDWTSFDELLNRMVIKIENYERAATPFPVLGVIDSLSIIKQATLICMADKYPSHSMSQKFVKRSRRDKIRIGYYSADYHNHATMLLMAELFEKHDRSKFEIIAFSFGPDKADDAMRKRVSSAFDKFIDIRTKTDKEVVELSRALEIDIAVDLKGFTKGARTDIFSFRAAPIQVNYLGYPGTMGAEFMDYLIADPVLVPKELQRFYTEKIVYMPNSYQVNDAKREIADKVFTRIELGLPKTGFVFSCFNNNYKITPRIFDCWMRILECVEGSVLWLLEDNPHVSDNLRMEAVRRGVDAQRLVFARNMPLPEHLARHRSADLFLDTFPYNAHTTASDALWAGLPVLTCIGESFAARVAASLLNAVQLPELITSTQEEYEALAIELATDPEKLSAIRRKLERTRITAPLFDSDLFTRHIEAAYEEMYERYQLDMRPDHIYVKPDVIVTHMQDDCSRPSA
jgi:predicted O-linked N-acetylglucosamine transferase (SPINDLY family)